MNYCIVENGMITNMIVCENDEIASDFDAVPSYDGACIGDEYKPLEESTLSDKSLDEMLSDLCEAFM